MRRPRRSLSILLVILALACRRDEEADADAVIDELAQFGGQDGPPALSSPR
jgi:hypothetical protein